MNSSNITIAPVGQHSATEHTGGHQENSQPQPDLWAKAMPIPADAGKPKPTTAMPSPTRQPKVGRASEKKRMIKQPVKEEKKRIKKGPVRYAKDAMRHLEVAQMIDVLGWLQKRIVDKVPKHSR